MPTLRFVSAKCFAVALGLCLSCGGSVLADGIFIPAANRTDLVYDQGRHTVYIADGSSVLRYDTQTNSFLSPFALGGSLVGVDISPDGDRLMVTDADYNTSDVWVHLVDLNTGVSNTATFPRVFGEAGTYAVAFGSDGAALITSRYQGSGSVPLRRYDPTTGQVSTLTPVSAGSMVSASPDRSFIGYAEAGGSFGDWGRYRVSDGDMLGTNTGWYNYEIGVRNGGTQFALPTYGGTHIFDENLDYVRKIGAYAGGQPICAAYDQGNVVYFPWADSTMVRAYRTDTFELLAEYDAEYFFHHPGNWAFRQGRARLSQDGALLFVTVGGGVQMISVPEPSSFALFLVVSAILVRRHAYR